MQILITGAQKADTDIYMCKSIKVCVCIYMFVYGKYGCL